MDVDFTYTPESNVIWMEAMAFRASDGGVVWSDAYRSGRHHGVVAAIHQPPPCAPYHASAGRRRVLEIVSGRHTCMGSIPRPREHRECSGAAA